MEYTKIHDKTLNETIYKGIHKSGLTVYVLPKSEHSKSYAAFATHYGSIDSEFIPIGESEKITVPDGIAHFLEHKMFEQPDGTDAFTKYNKTGANANAYTSSNMTCYLFSATDKIYESLGILLDFVGKPHFTDENIAKEQGIIGQEIKMYDDDPNWSVYFNMLEALYINHPLKKDIAGTVESISHITKEILYKCYYTFYNPSNMILFTCGAFEPDRVSELVDKYITATKENEIKRFYPDEPKKTNKQYVEQNLSVATPLFNIGFKDTDVGYDGDKLLKKEITTSIILEMISGDSSELFNSLYDEGLVNDNFGSDCELEKDYGFSYIGGESINPQEVYDRILNYIENTTLDESSFIRCKKVETGRFLRLWNSVDNITNNMVSYLFRNIDVFKYQDICDSITFEDVKERFSSHFTRENSVLSVIKPFEVDKND